MPLAKNQKQDFAPKEGKSNKKKLSKAILH